MHTLRNILILLAFLGSSCGEAHYPFNPETNDTEPIDTDTINAACDGLPGATLTCAPFDANAQGCIGTGEVTLGPLQGTLGCSTSHFQAAFLHWSEGSEGSEGQFDQSVDLLAWVPDLDDPLHGRFDPSVSLSLFADKCAKRSFGANPICPNQSFLTVAGLQAVNGFYVHLNSLSAKTAFLDFQLMPQNGWWMALPDAYEGLDCDDAQMVYGDQLLSAAVLGNLHEQSVARAPIPLLGKRTPWGCSNRFETWRQFGYRLINDAGSQLSITSLGIQQLGGDPVVFNFAFYSCEDGGRIHQGTVPLWEGCSTTQQSVSVLMDIYDFTKPKTKYVLLIQVSPTAGHTVNIDMSAQLL